jgi:hypothetical protein
MFLPLLALAAIGAAVKATLPDITRYLKIRSM